MVSDQETSQNESWRGGVVIVRIVALNQDNEVLSDLLKVTRVHCG